MPALNSIYSGTASFGKDYVTITSIIAAVICVFLFIGGVVLIFRKPEYTFQTTMTMNPSVQSGTSSTTTSGTTNTVDTYNNSGVINGCTGSVELLDESFTNYKGGEVINVYVKSAGYCADARVNIDNTKPVGILLVAISLLIILFTVINLFFVKKYKGVAAVEGAAGAFNLVRGLFGK